MPFAMPAAYGLDHLSIPVRVALASARRSDRPLFDACFLIDDMAARTVSGSREPMLAQIRLAWWREQIERGDPSSAVDPILKLAQESWGQMRSPLLDLLDGWEKLVGEGGGFPLNLDALADGRGACFAGLATMVGASDAQADARLAASLWTHAEFIAQAGSNLPNRQQALRGALEHAAHLHRFPRRLRPFAILGGLARRALDRGGEPLIGDRLSPLVTFRLGMFGR